jgi:hypothetical protein
MPSHTRRRQPITKWREPFCWVHYHPPIVTHTGQLVTGYHVPIHRDRTNPSSHHLRTARPGQPDADPDTDAAIRPPPESLDASWRSRTSHGNFPTHHGVTPTTKSPGATVPGSALAPTSLMRPISFT